MVSTPPELLRQISIDNFKWSEYNQVSGCLWLPEILTFLSEALHESKNE